MKFLFSLGEPADEHLNWLLLDALEAEGRGVPSFVGVGVPGAQAGSCTSLGECAQ